MISKNLSVVDKLLFALNKTSDFHFDKDVINRAFKGLGRAENKKWISDIILSELLVKDIKESINVTFNLSVSGIFYKNFPENMSYPTYGDKWGMFAI